MLSDHRYAMRYIYPAFFMLGAVLLVPLGFSVVASLMRWNLVPRRIHWLGLDNYIQIFQDTEVWHSVWLTLKFTVLSVGIEMLLGFLIAMFLNTDFRGCSLCALWCCSPRCFHPPSLHWCLS